MWNLISNRPGIALFRFEQQAVESFVRKLMPRGEQQIYSGRAPEFIPPAFFDDTTFEYCPTARDAAGLRPVRHAAHH